LPAIAQEGQLLRDLRQHDRADGQPGQLHGAEVPDHGGVHQQVEGLGGEHAQGRHGESQQLHINLR